MTTNICVKIEHFDDPQLPLDQRYVAMISEGKYKHMLVTGEDIADCFHQLSVSIDCMDDFRKKQGTATV